ncbi:Vacuolar DHA amino acid exporter [Mycena venus]|uniref:Vacuolar DHA amino acid exporter n=1 Tax=Mycena venus TaxID=2733690 RepID=A0A8H6XXS9_9AGAR|nr:Vacuolar DHA amino acid exporter [Mycena venus]
MSFSSYIKRQSRVLRKNTVASSAGLSSILEEPTDTITTEKKPKKNSMKARRRLGVSNLSIPHTSPLFTAVQALDDSERIARPPIPVFESSDELESSGSDSSGEGSSRSGSESPMPTTPSPTKETYAVAAGQCIIRCKSIKPLTLTKRSVSPIPPMPIHSLSEPSSPEPATDDEDATAWQDDDEYYATHASGFITLAPPLPPSFPTSTSAALPRRESATILTSSTRPSAPHRASVRLSRAITIPTRAPPPPPILTSSPLNSRSVSPASRTIVISTSPSTSPRPPPRTPVPTDAVAVARTDDYSSSLAALLSPPPLPHMQVERFPADVDVDEAGEWEDLDLECSFDADDLDFEDVPLSPSPLGTSASGKRVDDLEKNEILVEDEDWGSLPSPLSAPAPQTPASALRSRWSASTAPMTPAPTTAPETPALRSRWSASTSAALSPRPEDSYSTPEPAPETPALRSRWSASTAPGTPALRSRWSSSTLSSIHSSHSRARSPASKTFRRYFPISIPMPKTPTKSPKAPRPAAAAPAHPKRPRPRPTPMGSATVLRPRKQRKLTVDDVNVLIVGRPPSTSVLASACASPDVFGPSSNSSFSLPPPPATPQWAAYPSSPAIGAPSPALYAAYTTQRSPRRRVSNASNVSGWSGSAYASSAVSGSGSSESGHSDASTGSGLRRKPIPVEMFLR